MPYKRVSELPKDQTNQYSTHQKHAFMAAFNRCHAQGGDEEKCFAIAHHAAKQAPKEKPAK